MFISRIKTRVEGNCDKGYNVFLNDRLVVKIAQVGEINFN